ncbi:zf-HC2 domain-containing protein [Candidatus Bipolaricaulota bacterium]|nr:zf-HC2 domain-containing protein [Candidatus Bipolaricaulota bacterium]
MKTCTSIRELIPWYANGTLSDDEAQNVAAHIAQCESCRDELIENMQLSMGVRRAFEDLADMRMDIKKDVLSRTTGKSLASFDLGSFLLGFSFGASYQNGRIPIRGDLRVMGRKIRLISNHREVDNEQ